MSTPYAGNPDVFPDAITIPVDGVDLPTFTNIESPVEGNRDAVAFLNKHAAPVLNWRGAFLSSTVFGSSGIIYAACWDALLQQWVLVGQNGSGVDEMYWGPGTDDGSSSYWTNGVSASRNPDTMATCADPTTFNRYYQASALLTNLYIDYQTGSGSVNVRSVASKLHLQHPEMLTYNGRLIYVIGSSTSSEVTLSSAALSSPFSWTDQAIGYAATDWHLKTDNASIVLAIPRLVNSGVAPYYWYSTDGSTWSTGPLTTVLQNTNSVVTGLCWSPVRKKFFCVVEDTVAQTTVVWSSSDGKTWTNVSTTVSGRLSCSDLAALGTYLYCVQGETSNTGPSLAAFSPDAGVTWYRAQPKFATSTNSSAADYLRPRLAQGDFGLLAYNNLWARFSHLSGWPVHSL